MRINRSKAANIVWENLEIFKDLFEMIFKIGNEQSIKVAWVLNRFAHIKI